MSNDNQIRFNIDPKKLYWIQMPLSISKADFIQFLKQDIWLENTSLKDLNDSIKTQGHKVYFFNLDGILELYKLKSEEEVARDVAQIILSNSLKITLVHTTIINEKISSIFKKNKIPYFEGKIDTLEVMMDFSIKLVSSAFKENFRKFLRIKFIDFQKLSINIEKNGQKIEAFLKEISLNGAMISIKNSNNLEGFNLKEVISLDMDIYGNHIKINSAFITRVLTKESELGINFNLDNTKMVSKSSASQLSSLIYYCIHSIIEKKC